MLEKTGFFVGVKLIQTLSQAVPGGTRVLRQASPGLAALLQSLSRGNMGSAQTKLSERVTSVAPRDAFRFLLLSLVPSSPAPRTALAGDAGAGHARLLSSLQLED